MKQARTALQLAVERLSSSCPAQHGTPQHGTALHGTARHDTALHSTAQHCPALHSAAQHAVLTASTLCRQCSQAHRPTVNPCICTAFWKSCLVHRARRASLHHAMTGGGDALSAACPCSATGYTCGISITVADHVPCPAHCPAILIVCLQLYEGILQCDVCFKLWNGSV